MYAFKSCLSLLFNLQQQQHSYKQESNAAGLTVTDGSW